MPAFERSWQNRLIRGKNILPKIRNQGNRSTCSHHAVAGGIESAIKKAKAEIGEGFEVEVSIDHLISRLGECREIDDILTFVKDEGVLTTGGDVERLRISQFKSLEPQNFLEHLVQLINHVLSQGTAIGVFFVTSSYTVETTYYQDAKKPIFSDSSDEDEECRDNDDEAFKRSQQEEDEEVYHAVVLISLGMDGEKNLFWRVLDSHGTDAGEAGTRRIAVNLIKEAYIITP